MIILKSNSMLTIEEWNDLPRKDRNKLLVKHGVCSNLFRKEPNRLIMLYLLFKFYVEVWYKEDEKRIIKIRSFSETAELDEYLF